MRLPEWLLIPLVFLNASLARADGLTVDLGPSHGDTVTDEHEYAKTLQNEMFRGKKLKGPQIEAAYQLKFRPKDRFPSSWIFGLGYVSAAVDDSYPGGTLKLERDTTFILLGYRMQEETLAPNLVLGAELVMVKGIMGEVVLKSPTGRKSYEESYATLAPTVPTLAATAGYRLTPSLLLNAKFRVATSNVPNFFVGVTYDFENL